MGKQSSASESEENLSSEEDSGDETANEKGNPKFQEKVSDYESQRLKRIAENKRRMEALGLHKMATSFMGSVQKTHKMNKEKKRKSNVADEDEEYNPTQEDEETSSSAEEEDDDADDDFSSSKKRVKKNSSTPKKPGSIQKPVFESDFVEDDEALMQAIALSLQDSAGFLDLRSSVPPQSSGSKKIKENPSILEDSGKRKRKKSITSRVQMTEDEMLIHFFQFDETGRGGFTFRDIQRLAATHDFTWSEKEIADMVSCFDSDGDGKVSVADFRKIVCRCNMLKGPGDGVTGQ